MTAIEVAHDGTLWFAGWEGRLARLIPSDQNPRGERWLIYDQVLSTANVQDVVVHDGLVWLATDVGVAVIDGDECRMIAHREELDVVAGLVSPDKESIWWATANNGGLQLDLATEKLDWPILHLRGRQYRDVVQAADDSLLFLADYHFTWVEGENQRTVRFNDDVGQAAAVTTSNDLRPWIATDRGVATQTRDGWVLRHTTADGLPSNQVLDVLIGADGSLWVLSESAVTKIGR